MLLSVSDNDKQSDSHISIHPIPPKPAQLTASQSDIFSPTPTQTKTKLKPRQDPTDFRSATDRSKNGHHHHHNLNQIKYNKSNKRQSRHFSDEDIQIPMSIVIQQHQVAAERAALLNNDETENAAITPSTTQSFNKLAAKIFSSSTLSSRSLIDGGNNGNMEEHDHKNGKFNSIKVPKQISKSMSLTDCVNIDGISVDMEQLKLKMGMSKSVESPNDNNYYLKTPSNIYSKQPNMIRAKTDIRSYGINTNNMKNKSASSDDEDDDKFDEDNQELNELKQLFNRNSGSIYSLFCHFMHYFFE